MKTQEDERITVPHREELIYLLTEAAELEHGLMCCYLFAAFSLKRGTADLSVRESQAIQRWRTSIKAVAIEEMIHLVLVQNLLAAIGAAPHLQRPNFPVASGLYPADMVLGLRRFDERTLDHFIFLERPEGVELPDGEGFKPDRNYSRSDRLDRLSASAQDYDTVGALYRGIRGGFTELSRTLGEKNLFAGDPRAQVS